MNWSEANRRMGAWGVRDGVDRLVLYVLVWHYSSWGGVLIAYLVLMLIASVYDVYQKRKGKAEVVSDSHG